MMFCNTSNVKRAPTGSLRPEAKAIPMAAAGEYRRPILTRHPTRTSFKHKLGTAAQCKQFLEDYISAVAIGGAFAAPKDTKIDMSKIDIAGPHFGLVDSRRCEHLLSQNIRYLEGLDDG